MELLAGATLVTGAAAGGMLAAREVSAMFGREALAAQQRTEPNLALVRPPPVSPRTELKVFRPASTGMFEGIADELLLEPLLDGALKKVKFNHGGSSVSLRLDFENGARAAFKPLQINLQSIPRREVAAFRINRLLGLSSVPPAVGRRFTLKELLDNLAPEHAIYRPRLEAEMIVEDGYVVGEMSWWIPVIERGFISGFEIDSTDGIVTWKRQLTIGEPIPEADRNLVGQISTMVLFDFVINNPDRWSGGNARVSPDGRRLYFMDNTLSFGDSSEGHVKVRTYLERSQKFSASLVNRLRQLTEEELRYALSRELGAFAELLVEEEITAILSRRDVALEYIDNLIRQYGADAVLVFP